VFPKTELTRTPAGFDNLRVFDPRREAQTFGLHDADRRRGGCQILLASGSVQFLETPLWSSISKLSFKPKHVLINRAALTEEDSFVTLHNFGNAICPYRIWNAKVFRMAFEELGYSLVDVWAAPEFSCYIPFHANKGIRPFSGLYFRDQR